MRFRSFQSRIVVVFLGLLTTVQAAGFFAVSVAMTQNARARITDELAVGGNVFTRLIRARTEHLAEAARLLSGDFAFKAAASSDDRDTVLSVLENHQARIGADVMMLASLNRTLMADTLHRGDPAAALLPFPGLVARAEQAGEASAIVTIDGHAYQIVAVPLLAPLPIAWICVGFVIDDRVARDLQSLTLLQVSFLRAGEGGWKSLASTLPGAMREALLRSLPAPTAATNTSRSVRIGAEEYMTLVTSLGDTSDGAIVAVLQRSLDAALEPARRLQLALLAISAGGLLVSVTGGVVIARRVTKPVRDLVESARRIERGDYEQSVRVTQQDEIGELAATFNHMAKGLAERDRVRAELERVGRLKRFFSPQLAELLVSAGDEAVLASHRREITVVFCDLRGFAAFAETAEPEEVMGVLREYHEAVGPEIFRFEGTLERFTGDGLMVFFNDPVPCADPAARAVRMADRMRHNVGKLIETWQRRGHTLGFGVGIAMGYATLGRIGFEGRLDYAAIGTVTNLSARLCSEAQSGQILVSQRVYTDVQDLAEAEPAGSLTLTGFVKPVPAFNVLRVTERVTP